MQDPINQHHIEHLTQSIDHRSNWPIYNTRLFRSFRHCRTQAITSKTRSLWYPGQTLACVEAWLVTALNRGPSSEISMIRSGVPQGTVLGPLCFLLYINDVGDDISWQLKLFADDSLLYGVIHNMVRTLWHSDVTNGQTQFHFPSWITSKHRYENQIWSI